MATIYRSMEVLTDFPKQVIVLKSTGEVCGLSPRGAGLQSRLIDEEQTRGFPRYCGQLAQAKAGNKNYERQLLGLGRDADGHLGRMLEDAIGLPESLADIAKGFTPAELAVIRSKSTLPEPVLEKMMHMAMFMAAHLMRDHPKVRSRPKDEDVPNTFIFRFALCAMVWAIERIGMGNLASRTDRMRNDIVDLSFATYATYFDGLMSKDARLNKMYSIGLLFLTTIRRNWQK